MTESVTPKAQRTRAALLATARSLVGELGVDGVNVMSVCAAADVGRTSFYNYFDDSSALVSVLAQEAAEDIKHRFDRLHRDMPRGKARLDACIGMILALAVEAPDHMLMLTSLARSVPEVAELLATEIVAELTAHQANDAHELGRHLAVATMAIARHLAEQHGSPDDAARHTSYLMKAVG